MSEYFIIAHYKDIINGNKSIHVIKDDIFPLSPETNKQKRSNENICETSNETQIINTTIKFLV